MDLGLFNRNQHSFDASNSSLGCSNGMKACYALGKEIVDGESSG
jgi:hypothetical protein